MIIEEEKDYIKTNLKWKFNWFNFFQRYFILFGPIGITLIACSMFYGGFKFGHIYNNNFMNPFFFTASCGLLLGLFFTCYTIRRIETERKFQLLEHSNISFTDISDKTATIKWTIIGEDKDVIRASTRISLISWGECVTIIKVSDKSILVNTQPFGRQPFTFNRDKVNFKKLIDALS